MRVAHNTIDLTGQQFGLLYVVKRDEVKRKDRRAYWICQCECGKTVSVVGNSLRKGYTKSCGDKKHKKGMNCIDLTGKQFGMLTVLARSDKSNNGEVRWDCQCECGNIKDISGEALRYGMTHSCGCMHYEWVSSKVKKHGMSKTKLYNVWSEMKSRCYNPKDKSYPNYGARGIVVCDEWKNNPSAFFKWAYENGYDESKNPRTECSIDRIDNDGMYAPSNCRWVDINIQAYNKRRTIMIEYNGVIHTIKEWSDITGLKKTTIRDRYYRGWTADRILGYGG